MRHYMIERLMSTISGSSRYSTINYSLAFPLSCSRTRRDLPDLPRQIPLTHRQSVVVLLPDADEKLRRKERHDRDNNRLVCVELVL